VGVSRGRTANLKLNLINYDVVGYGVAEDENWQIIDSMVSQFIRMNGIIGTWKNSTQYTVGDVTVDIETGSLWECSVSNVSSATGSFAADRVTFPARWVTVKTNTGDSGNTAVSRPEDFGATSVEDEQIPDGEGDFPPPVTALVLSNRHSTTLSPRASLSSLTRPTASRLRSSLT
jgi:hypothetical protein